jgi:phytoene dehydrogenase-like protein
MNMKKDKYEIIIVGSGLGGMVAGTLLARAKRHVLLLKERKYQPHFTRNGYQFSPFSSFSKRCLKASLVQRLIQRLELALPTGSRGRGEKTPEETGKVKKYVSRQVILPKARIDLFSQRALLKREWEREFPSEAARIEGFYDELRTLLNRSRDKGESDPFFPVQLSSRFETWLSLLSLFERPVYRTDSFYSKEFRMFVQLQLVSRGNFYSEQFPTSLAAYLMTDEEPDPCEAGADLTELEGMVLRKFSESGGVTEEIEGIEKVDLGWRKDVSVLLTGDRRLLQSQVLIFNSPLHSLKHIQGEASKPLAKWIRRIQPRYIVLPFFMGIREKIVPVGMKDLLVSVIDLDKPLEKGNLVFVALSPKGDEMQAPEGRRALMAGSLLPYEETAAVRNQDALAEHQKAVMEHLRRIIPFLENHIEFIDTDWTRDQILCWSYPHFLYETRPPFRWTRGVVPTRVSKKIYFTGKENFPYLGLEGEILAGLMVGTQVSALTKK